MRIGLLITAAVLALAACNQGNTPAEKPVEAAAAQAAGERFYDREAFTIRYSLTGTQTGERIEHVRDWGKQRATIENSVMAVMGTRQTVNQRTVMDGPDLYTINLDTGETTVMQSPLYEDLREQMRGQSGVEFGRKLMIAMGGKETGETGTFVGERCAYWELMGSRMCVADWGATLHVVASIGPVKIEQTAVEIRMGDAGPADAYAYDASKAKRLEAPNIQMEDLPAIGQGGEEAMKKLDEMMKTMPQN